MGKFAALFTDSYKELKSVRTITTLAMFAAIAIVLGAFSINAGNYIRIGFSSIPNGLAAYLFGPVAGGIFAGVLDVLKYLVKPTGAFYPPLTLVTLLAGTLYGIFYYKKKITLPRVLVTKFVVMLLCNVILNTMCLADLYGEGFFILLPARLIKNLVMWPIDSVIFWMLAQALERTGAFRLVRRMHSTGSEQS